MNSVSVTVHTCVLASQIAAFEYIVPIDLTTIFTGYSLLPAVRGTENQTGDWDGTGQTRTVLLSDGSSSQEIITKYDYPNYFSYTVKEFTGILRFFTKSADGEWWFDSISSDKTYIKWKYAFNAKSILAIPFLWFITKVLWRNYMHKALRLSKNQVEYNND